MKRLMRGLALGAMALMAAACSTSPTGTAGLTAAQRVYQAHATLVGLEQAAVTYANRPWCGDAGAPAQGCADAKTVVAIAQGNHVALEAVRTAEKIVADSSATGSSIVNAVLAAEDAVTGMTRIMAAANVAGGGK